MKILFNILGIALFSFLNYGCNNVDAWTGDGTGGTGSSGAPISALTDYIDDANLTADEFRKYDTSDNLEKVMAIATVNPFATNDDGGQELFVIDGDGNNFTQLTTANSLGHGVSFGRITADGSKILFSGDANFTGDNTYTFAMSLYEINSDGTGLQQLTPPIVDYGSINSYFGMSADGTKAVFAASRDFSDAAGGYPAGQTLHLLDVTTGVITKLHTGAFSYVAPVMSADGSTVAFASSSDLTGNNPDNSREIFVIKTADSSLTQVTNYTGMDVPQDTAYHGYYLHIASDGSFIIFVSASDLIGSKPNFSTGLYRVDVATGTTYLLSDPDSTGVSLSPIQAITSDDRKVIFMDSYTYEINADGTNELIRSGYPDSAPTPNGDGSRIIIESKSINLPETTDYGASQLYIIQ